MKDYFGEFFYFNGIKKPIHELSELSDGNGIRIYEVFRAEEGVLLFFEDHMERLNNTLTLLQINPWLSTGSIKRTVTDLIKENKFINGPIKLIFYIGKPQNYFLANYMQPIGREPNDYIKGVKTIFIHEERVNPNAKLWNQEFRDFTVRKLQEHNAIEALLVDHEGFLTEGSRSNIFLIKKDSVYTTPMEYVLPGVTRKKVMQICQNAKISLIEKRIHKDDLHEYEALFLTGTSRKILPVRNADDITFNTQNELMGVISDEFEKLVINYIDKAKLK